MNASLPSVPPAASAPSPQAAPAAPDDAPETSFREVLSGEIAQQQTSATQAAETDRAATNEDHADAGEPLSAAGVPDPGLASLSDTLLLLARQIDPETTARADQDAPPAADAVAADATAAVPATDAALPLVGAASAPVPGEPAASSGTRAGAASGVASPASPTASARAGTPESRTHTAAPGQLLAADPDSSLMQSSPAAAAQTPSVAPGPDRLPDFAAAMSAAQTPQLAVAASAPLAASERLSAAVGTPAWSQALGERIVWMVAGGQQSASLTLNPPDLGPMQIVLHVSNEQATANFFAPQAEVRQALEAALPRLREMMQDAGIQLGQASVRADTPSQQNAQDHEAPRSHGASGRADGVERALVPPPPVRAGRGLVDTFA